jgi:hypothetical protein
MRGEWDGTERRKSPNLSDGDVELIAVRAAEILERHLFERIGRAVWEKLLFVVGALGLAGFAWLHGAGKIVL